MKTTPSMLCSIYKITNQINHDVYIGQTWKTVQQRFAEHKRPSNKSCIKLKNALNKYGRDNFVVELITVCSTQDTADYWERYFITKYDSINTGYNLRQGGHGDYNTMRNVLSASLRGRPSPLRGRAQPKELILKRTRGQKGRKKSPEQVAKVAAALTGRKQTPEHIANMKAAQAAVGYKHSPETLDKMRGPKAISDEQLAELLNSDLGSKEACSKYGISRTTYWEYRRKAPDSKLANTPNTPRRSYSNENHPGAKVSWELVDAIRADYETGKLSYNGLAQKYKLGKTTIAKIIKKKSWVR
jgi:group I intron endonuclease